MVSSLIFVLAAVLASSIPATEAFVKWPTSLSAKSLVPKCEYNNKTATCCSSLTNVTQTKLCATFQVNLNELNVKASLSFNEKTLVERKVEVGKLCAPVGGVVPIMACLNFYWVEVGFVLYPDDMHCNICFQGSVSSFATVDFQCLRYQNGTFSRNSDHKPTNKGWINLDAGK
ncbi:uncharacterized protein [Halyomorpha halys]|uniref:uncharacterized protein isoform X2 n=1 Tax=Halyomorpha halys TaxID=286706 RepID=UPI0006D51FCD|nr:uncharacterized protein LOC106690304 [Halyomorpha halys]